LESYFYSTFLGNKNVGYVTVSTKVKRELLEKARRYNVNVSQVLRRALEEEVRRRELEWAVSVMDDISRRAKLEKPSDEVIREFRESRGRVAQ
jgi:post-segregation antitoxin (ccd killing protein)